MRVYARRDLLQSINGVYANSIPQHISYRLANIAEDYYATYATPYTPYTS